MGIGSRNDRLLYPVSVRIQLEQMGDLGGSFPLPQVRPTASDKLPNQRSLRFPLRADLVLKRLFRTPEEVAQDHDRLMAEWLAGGSGHLHSVPTNR